MRSNCRYISSEEVLRGCVYLAARVKQFYNSRPQVVLGIARGGLVPATYMSHLLDIPMRVAHYSSPEGRGETRADYKYLPPLTGFDDVLIVDDVSGSGRTLEYVVDYYTRRKKRIVSCTLVVNESPDERLHPMLYWVDTNKQWVVFPWEME